MSIPFALSLSKYVNSAGTDVGFASLLAVALLALLYFAGARESRTLRDQLEDAQDRITALEARLTQALRNQAAAARSAAGAVGATTVPGRPGVVPAPRVAAHPMGSTVARVGRAGASQPAAVPALIGAPAGAGAAALGSATKLIPSPEIALTPEPIGVPSATPTAVPAGMPAAVGAQTAVAGVGFGDPDDDEFADEFGPEHTLLVPATTAAGSNGGAGGSGPVALPPRMQFSYDDPEPQGPPPRRTIPTVDTGPSAPRRVIGRLGAVIAALVVVAAIVVALLLITGSGSNKAKPTVTARTPPATTRKKATKAAVFDPAKVKVSVLNATAVTGLATDVGKELADAGYTVPQDSVTNASVQTVVTSTVGYLPGYRSAAFRVAASLSKATGVAVTSVVPASSASITSCGTAPTGQTTNCPADVIVTVGSDLTSVAASAGTT